MKSMREAFAAGYDSLSAWADLLDRINVFPVADGDTGANLRVSLAPLRDCAQDSAEIPDQLAGCAVGNSGNIAAAFFREFCRAEGFGDLAGNAARGREKAWQALAAPRSGTMLNVFDCLVSSLAGTADPHRTYTLLRGEMQEVVLATSGILPDLREAGVVDSGALGMYVFFESFFRRLTGKNTEPPSILELFAGRLSVNPAFQPLVTDSYCVNAVIHAGNNRSATAKYLAGLGESVVTLPAGSGIKIHIHTRDRQELRTRLSVLGEIVHWSDEAIDDGATAGVADPGRKEAVHIMTDAAGSLTRQMARQHGITLLDSYILAGNTGRPESLCPPAEIYSLMRAGKKVSTAQASTFERHQCYRNVCRRFGKTLYLCTGSAFTGNYDIARRWKEENDPDNLLEVLDTGAASGRLGLIALLTARHAQGAAGAGDVSQFARGIMDDCREYVFIDELRYLVAGGRVSRTGGFFADLLHLKPVITPTRDGVRKAGVVRNRKEQLSFALERLARECPPSATPVIMLQYSDNAPWVAETVLPRISRLLPDAEIILTPLSLTSGVHMGPGTWSVAWA